MAYDTSWHMGVILSIYTSFHDLFLEFFNSPLTHNKKDFDLRTTRTPDQ